jgi:dynein heavy chain 1
VQERLRYVPLGWSKSYEFNDADLDCAFTTIDNWLDSAANGRANISPEKIPWQAIGTLFKESVYGGRVDNDSDQDILNSFVDTLFTPHSYDIDFTLVPETSEGKAVLIPDGTRIEQFLDWVNKLPEREPPTWLGLPANAEHVLLTIKGNEMLAKVLKLKDISDEM